MQNQQNLSAIMRAKKWGLWWLYMIIPHFALSVLAFFVGDNIAIDIIGLVFFVVIALSYIFLLFGIRALSKEVQHQRLEKDIVACITLSVLLAILGLMISLPSFFSPEFIGLVGLAALPVFFLVGIVAIRLGTDFKNLGEQWGDSSRKAGKWHRISGYLIVSIILFPIGFVLSLIADFFMWRVLKEQVGNQAPQIQHVPPSRNHPISV